MVSVTVTDELIMSLYLFSRDASKKDELSLKLAQLLGSLGRNEEVMLGDWEELKKMHTNS